MECVLDAGADALCAGVVGVCGVFGLDGGEADGEGMGERGFYSLSFYVTKARLLGSMNGCILYVLLIEKVLEDGRLLGHLIDASFPFLQFLLFMSMSP